MSIPMSVQELLEATKQGNAAAVHRILQALPPEWIDLSDDEGVRAIDQAVFQGADAIVEMLIAHGADFHATDDNEGSALLTAAIWDRSSTLKLLLRHGANVNASDSAHGTALQYALQHDNPETARCLIEAGATPPAGMEWLHDAAEAARQGNDRRLQQALAGKIRAHLFVAEVKARVAVCAPEHLEGYAALHLGVDDAITARCMREAMRQEGAAAAPRRLPTMAL